MDFFSLSLQRSGIGKLIPEMVIDDYLFEPCGYSMNGIAKLNVSNLMLVRGFKQLHMG